MPNLVRRRKTKFMILMTVRDEAWSELSSADQAQIFERHNQVSGELTNSGKLISSHRLRPVAEARTVRKRSDGTVAILDGPFCETKDAIGGYYLIDCDSIDEAPGWAERLRFMPGANEVRAVWEDQSCEVGSS